MKMILLLSAAYTNAGAFVDAGNHLSVGEGKPEITAERAKDMVLAGRAEEVDTGDADDVEGEEGAEGEPAPSGGRRGRRQG